MIMYILQSTITEKVYIQQIDKPFYRFTIVNEKDKATLYKTKEQAKISKNNLKYSHIHTKFFKIVEL